MMKWRRMRQSLLAKHAYRAQDRRLVAEQLEARWCPASVNVLGGPASVPEGDSGSKDYFFTVELSAAVAFPVTVDYLVLANTATYGPDFSAFPNRAGRLTFLSGEFGKSIGVRVFGDTAAEADESFSVRLSNPRGCVLGTAVTSCTIVDDDTYTLSLSPLGQSVAEGDSALFTLSLSMPAKRVEKVVVYTANGSAISPKDYRSIGNPTLTFALGETVKVVSIATVSDSIVEPDEFFNVFAVPTNPSLGGRLNAAVVIQDAAGSGPPVPPVLPTVAVIAKRPQVLEAGTGVEAMRFSRIATDVSQPLLVQYTVAGTAQNSVDYQTLTGDIWFLPGRSTVDLIVTPIDDTDIEEDEDIIVTLKPAPTYTISNPPGIAFTDLISNDTVISVRVLDNQAAEDIPPDTGLVQFARTGAIDQPLTVRCRLTGTAITGLDYTRPASYLPLTSEISIIFSAGQATVDFGVVPIDDSDYEEPETVVVTILPSTSFVPTYARGSLFVATVSIASNDIPIVVTVDAPDPLAKEVGLDPGFFRFTRTGSTALPLTVKYKIVANDWRGYATNGADYNRLPSPWEVIFPKGETSVDLSIIPINDEQEEYAEEIVKIQVESGVGYAVTDTLGREAQVIIVSDERKSPLIDGLGFKLDVALQDDPRLDGAGAVARRYFMYATQAWSSIFEDVPDTVDKNSGIPVDDFVLEVKFVSSPSDPVNKPWQQAGFGGAWMAKNYDGTYCRRSGLNGLPYRGEMEITTAALNPVYWQSRAGNHSVFKLQELMGRALGFNCEMLKEQRILGDPLSPLAIDFRVVRPTPWHPDLTPTPDFIDYRGWAIRTTLYTLPTWLAPTFAAKAYGLKIPPQKLGKYVIPLHRSSWDQGIARWDAQSTPLRPSGSSNLKWDIFVYGWEGKNKVDGDEKPTISLITIGLFKDLGYKIK